MQPVDRANIPVVILCGGLGTRLREETELRPKPMVEIGNAPILWHIMKLYSSHGFRRFILCLGYKGYVIKDFFASYGARLDDLTVELGRERVEIHHHNSVRWEPWRVTLAETGQLTNTGGRISRIRKYIDTEVFLATYGDGLADIDLAGELDFHLAHGRVATLSAMNPRSRFGVLDLTDDGNVTRFREKPLLDRWVNGGFYAFRREVFDYLDDDCVLEVDPLARLAADGKLMAFRHLSQFYTMDTLRDVTELNRLWAEGKAAWKVWED